MQQLIKEARSLIEQLDAALDAYYFDHPRLGWIVNKEIDNPLMRRKIRRVLARANRRLARRLTQNGTPPPIQGAMWIINSRDSSWF